MIRALASYVCPHCGAQVKKPKPGETTTCTFCQGELHAPEQEAPPPQREIVREIVREVVITRDSGDDPDALPPEERARRRKTAQIWTAVVGVVGTIAIVVMTWNAKKDADDISQKYEDERARKAQCAADCRSRCEREQKANPREAGYTPDPYDPPELKKQMAETEKLMIDADITVCAMSCEQNACP